MLRRKLSWYIYREFNLNYNYFLSNTSFMVGIGFLYDNQNIVQDDTYLSVHMTQYTYSLKKNGKICDLKYNFDWAHFTLEYSETDIPLAAWKYDNFPTINRTIVWFII